MDYFAGLDVSVKETSVCIVDDAGKIVREARMASEPEALLQVLTNTIYRLKRVGLEAGPLSQWLYSVLAEAGLPVIPRASLAHNDAEAVVLDLVQPSVAGRQLIGFGWETWRDEPGREGTLQHAEQIKSRNGGRNWAAGPCVGQLVICACLNPDADDKSRPADNNSRPFGGSGRSSAPLRSALEDQFAILSNMRRLSSLIAKNQNPASEGRSGVLCSVRGGELSPYFHHPSPDCSDAEGNLN